MAHREPALPGVLGQLPPVGARPAPGVDGFAEAASGVDKDFKGDEVEENGADVVKLADILPGQDPARLRECSEVSIANS